MLRSYMINRVLNIKQSNNRRVTRRQAAEAVVCRTDLRTIADRVVHYIGVPLCHKIVSRNLVFIVRLTTLTRRVQLQIAL